MKTKIDKLTGYNCDCDYSRGCDEISDHVGMPQLTNTHTYILHI